MSGLCFITTGGVLKAEVIAEEIKSLFSYRITYLLEKAAV